MDIQGLNDFTKDNMRRSATWITILVITLAFLLIIFLRNQYLLTLNSLRVYFGIVCIISSVAFGIGFLSPLPWLYSGNHQLRANVFRGTLQSLPFNIAWLAIAYSITFLILMDDAKGIPGPYIGGEIDEHIKYWQWIRGGVANVVIATIIGGLIANQGVEKIEKESMMKSLNQERLHGLQVQLSPHVLHNSLNGLAELVHLDPNKAEQGILNLSSLYREFLVLTSKRYSSIGEESTLIQKWLSIEQLRLGSRVQVEWQWDENLNAIKVPPLILQPLVENAIKHGVTPFLQPSVLRIHASRIPDNRIVLRVENSGAPLNKSSTRSWGIGLTNLDSRLKLIYGELASLKLSTDGTWTLAEITIPDHYPMWSR